MSQGQESLASTVLLLEADPFLRRLISLGLQNRGFEVLEIATLSILPDLDGKPIDLLVLDLDCGVTCDNALLEAAQTHPTLATIPTVALAWDYPVAISNEANDKLNLLTKPFDARRLHKAIDTLIAARTAEKVRQEAQAEAILLASYTKHASPSVWPMITAAGLLLAVIGMLLQMVLVFVGAAVVIASLLLWTVGSRSVSQPDLALDSLA